MSINNLQALVEKMRKYDAGELPVDEMTAIKRRFEESRKRMDQYDKEIEARVKASEVTQELLRKVCNL